MDGLGELAAIWRYPVKSLSAESLESARIEPNGLPGDRSSALFVESGHARIGKTYRGKEHNLLHITHEVADAIGFAAERGVIVTPQAIPGTRYFDAAPVSLIFDRWIAQVERGLGVALDPRRWRPNLYARASHDFDYSESQLVDRVIEVGQVALRVREPIERCVTTTYDIQTGDPNNDVLRYVAVHRGNLMGVYCEVELAGTVRAGDPLRLRAR